MEHRSDAWGGVAAAALIGVAFFAATFVGIVMSDRAGDTAVLWPPNAILLTVLLTARHHHVAHLAAAALASLAANLLTHHGLAASLIATIGNLIEVGLAAWLIRRWAGPSPLWERVAGVVKFTLIAGFLAPAVAATFAAAGLSLLDSRFGHVWYRWFVGDALGLLILAPMLLIGHRLLGRGPDAVLAARAPAEVALLLAATFGLAFAAFAVPFEAALFPLLPLVLLATFRLGPIGAAASCALIASVGAWATVHDIGPMVRFDGTEPDRILYLQLYLAVLFLSALPVAAALAERQALAAELLAARDSARTAAQSFYDLATTEELTQAASRRRFLEQLQEEVDGAATGGQSLALALFDVDRFKAINDAHGHPAGDAVLRAIADVARQTVRTRDVVGRLGGEEFAILMPGTSFDGAAAACERLRARIEGRTVALASGASVAATVSVGLVMLSGQDAMRLLSDADRALYEAKQAGRNRLAIAA